MTDDDSEDNVACCRDIADAKAKWRQIYKAVRRFFDDVLRQHAFLLTERGLAIKRTLYADARVIDRFVRDFDRIAHLDKEGRGRSLTEFFAAAHSFRTGLGEMAFGSDINTAFHGCFKPVAQP
jgi:hypothetical protein